MIVSDTVPWLLQFTFGELDSPEMLTDVTDKPRLQWLGYELVRHAFRGKTSWTWRRSKEEMEGLFGWLVEKCDRRQWREVERLLQSAAREPGFHGIREQTYQLCQAAQQRGYDGPIPHLYYMQKIKHGESLSPDWHLNYVAMTNPFLVAGVIVLRECARLCRVPSPPGRYRYPLPFFVPSLRRDIGLLLLPVYPSR